MVPPPNLKVAPRSLLIILYIKVNRDAALRSSKVFHPKLLPDHSGNAGFPLVIRV